MGREEGLALPLRHGQKAKQAEGQVAPIVGESAIGKSRVICALRERLAGQGYTPLRDQCSPGGEELLSKAMDPRAEAFL